MTTRQRDTPRALIRYALVSATVTVALVWLLYLVRDTLLLIYVAGLIAVGLSPLVDRIEQQRLTTRIRLPRWAAILSVYVVVFTVVGLFVMLMVPPLASQARDLFNAAPDLVSRGQQWLIRQGVLGREITIGEAVRQAPAGSDAVGTVLAAIWGFVGGVFGVVTILIVTFYLLIDADDMVRAMVRLFPRQERARVRDAFRRAGEKVSAWLAGQLLLGAIIGTTAAIGLWIMGVPYFYVLALIAGIGELIPIVGPLLSAVPAVAVAFSVSPATALGVAVFFFLQQQVENHVLVPKVMSRQVGISPVLVITALLIGGSLLGLVGAILAVPTAAILQVLLQELLVEATAD
ncbi:MAG TPA: AI-2E family transporter [Vicinamibacterales bacterium]|nr:AI-2E family transporter [Vicinamibacterales bacterium]